MDSSAYDARIDLLTAKLEQLIAKFDAHIADEHRAAGAIDERIHGLEGRMDQVEAQAVKIPYIEQRVVRVEKLILELQGEWRHEAKLADGHRRELAGKLDTVLAVLAELRTTRNGLQSG